MRVIGIDPGLTSCGAAWNTGRGDRIVTLTVRPKDRDIHRKGRTIVRELPDVCWDLMVIELPQVYQGEKQEGDPNDLIKLAVLVGYLTCGIAAYRIELVRPQAWKGSVPKHIHHTRLRAMCTDLNGKISKDAMDAAGLYIQGKELLEAEEIARRKRRPM